MPSESDRRILDKFKLSITDPAFRHVLVYIIACPTQPFGYLPAGNSSAIAPVTLETPGAACGNVWDTEGGRRLGQIPPRMDARKGCGERNLIISLRFDSDTLKKPLLPPDTAS